MKQPLLLKLLDVCHTLDVHYRGHQHLVGLFFGHFKREYRTCVRAVRAALGDLNILDVPAVLLDNVNYNTKILRLAVLNENVKGARGVKYRIFKLDECEFYDKYDERRDDAPSKNPAPQQSPTIAAVQSPAAVVSPLT